MARSGHTSPAGLALAAACSCFNATGKTSKTAAASALSQAAPKRKGK